VAPIDRFGFESSEDVKEARDHVRRQLGTELAEKASDQFCLAISEAAAPRFRYAAEAGPGEPAGGVTAILEFSPAAETLGRLPKEVGAEIASTVREAVGSAVEGTTPGQTPMSLFMRIAAVNARREAFLKTAGPVHDELERTVAALANPGRRPGIQAEVGHRPAVEVCWLNGTMRATTDPRALTEVVADPNVQKVDLPRMLQQEQVAMDVTIEGAAQMRETTGLTGKGITVGVIDSEVALRHPAFQDRVIHKRNYTREPFGTPGSHGTAVAGFIGANSDVMQGIAPEVAIYNYKVMCTNRFLNTDDFGGALAIQQALEDGVRVVNCSWFTGPASHGEGREAVACDAAWGLGLTIVKSAGNQGPGVSSITTPGDAQGVIVVGGTDPSGTAVPDYSSRGPLPSGEHRPHLVAPGGSPSDPLESALDTGGFGAVGWGTSYAAPHVTGILALLLEAEPELTPGQQRDRLINACDSLAGLGEDLQGKGLISPSTLLTGLSRA
jgi:serine protease AprX